MSAASAFQELSQPRATPPRRIVLHVRRHVANASNPTSTASRGQVTAPLAPVVGAGISLGSLSSDCFHCLGDPTVEPEHGTLDCTSKLGIWVYADHSVRGSRLNDSQRVHQDAVVVHDGDRLQLGDTEIELRFEAATAPATLQEALSSVAATYQLSRPHEELTLGSCVEDVSDDDDVGSATWPALSKAQQAKHRLAKIDTSGLGFPVSGLPGSLASQTIAANPPEYTASPIPGASWRKKRNSLTTAMLNKASRRSPSPPLEKQTHKPQAAFQRPRTRLVPAVPGAGPSTPPRQHKHVDSRPYTAETGKTARPPPMEYSSSPVGTPATTSPWEQTRVQPPPMSLPLSLHTHANVKGIPPPPLSVGAKPKSQRDNLRIQVSKKMAAAAPGPASVGKAGVQHKPRVLPAPLEFPGAPASPVAQKDILQQQESLLSILQSKFEEEQQLKQQQAEWMRQCQLPVPGATSSRGESSTTSTPLSPIRSLHRFHEDLQGAKDQRYFPNSTPTLLHTKSLGLTDQTRQYQPSPRLKAAVRASRARFNTFEEKASVPATPRTAQPSRTTTRTRGDPTSTLVLSPSLRDGHRRRSNQDKHDDLLRVSDESVASSATTVVACHRRVTRSLSISSDSASSADLSDFLGYEEDTADSPTSYTAPELYGSAELLRRSREDAALLGDSQSSGGMASLFGSTSSPHFSTSRAASTAFPVDLQLSSPRPQTGDKMLAKFGKSTVSNNQLHDVRSPRRSDNDSPDGLGSFRRPVWSPKDPQFDPLSPYKSAAALNHRRQQQLRQPVFGPEDGASEPEEDRQSKLSRMPPSFRRHVSAPAAKYVG